MSEEKQKPSLAKRVFIGVLLIGFLIMGAISMKRALPDTKEERIYKAIKAHSPYVYEKRLGGLTIVDSRDGRKEKPSAAETLLRMDELDKEWAQEYLQVVNNDIVITKEDNTTVKIFIETPKEREFVKSFFGI
ncbi:MAG: hypothetical protein DRG78_22105 [Epsilonproteobacteria bacterium]|nr:MAG: hypothetical protein DRG78_22105 [Campylobacterota bacterium]